jgi:hypothetical protein
MVTYLRRIASVNTSWITTKNALAFADFLWLPPWRALGESSLRSAVFHGGSACGRGLSAASPRGLISSVLWMELCGD